MEKYKVAIIILVWNDYKNTKKCLESLRNISYSNIEIIVVDNNSFDNSCIQLSEEYDNIKFIFNNENLGYAAGNNRGIEYAINNGADFIFVMNNDVTIDSSNIIDIMLESFEKVPQLGILGPKLMQLSSLGDFHEVSYKSRYYDIIRKILLRKQFDDITNSNDKTFKIRTVVSGCALMIKKEVIEKTGGFNEEFFMFVEENDLCLRTIKSGFIVGQSNNDNTIVRHLGGVSYSKTAAWKYFLLNRNKFIEFRSFSVIGQIGLFVIHLIGLIMRSLKWLIKGEFNYISSAFWGTIYGIRLWMRDSLNLSYKGEYLEQGRLVASGKHPIRKYF